ncbi:MAG: hypothetical protein ED559_02450 [Phycisphaera sp.]|nr:MAG: hypothetical protein ED559_02450 [Phycisphaera sp.]
MAVTATNMQASGSGGAERAFGSAAEHAIREAQTALTGMIAEAGLEGGRAVDLARTLKLDKTLAWKLARFTDQSDPCSAFKHLPGQSGVEIVIKAAGNLGVPSDRLEAVRKADSQLRGFVRNHAGDRRTFEAMLAGARPDAETEAEERKAFFRAGSAIWGVRARAQLLMLALAPSNRDPAKLDCVQVSGFVDLERLRPDVPWVIRRLRVHEDDGSPSQGFEREPLDTTGTTAGSSVDRPLSLMTSYCSRPLPKIIQRVGQTGWLYDEIAPGDVGRKGAVTVIAGERYHAALPRNKSKDNTEGRYILTVRTPVEHVQFDLLLHPDLAHFRWPTVTVAGNLEERISSERADGRELFPIKPAESVTPGVTRSPFVAVDYSGLVSDAFSRAGLHSLHSYRCYRAAIDHPPAPCEITLTCDLEGAD